LRSARLDKGSSTSGASFTNRRCKHRGLVNEVEKKRAAAVGAEVVRLRSDRQTGLPDTYRDAKRTLAVVTASPSRRRLQLIPPFADWPFDLAEGRSYWRGAK
jgi:hypothetical protein